LRKRALSAQKLAADLLPRPGPLPAAGTLHAEFAEESQAEVGADLWFA